MKPQITQAVGPIPAAFLPHIIMSETFQFLQRFAQVRGCVFRELVTDTEEDTDIVLADAESLLRTLLEGPYLRSLELAEHQRDRSLPEWSAIRQRLDGYDLDDSDPQPLEMREPRLDYDVEHDEFFFPLYGGVDPDQSAGRRVPTLQDILLTWNRHRIGAETEPLKNYTHGAIAVLEALTNMDPESPPWIALVNGMIHVRGIPTSMSATQAVANCRGGLWDQKSLD